MDLELAIETIEPVTEKHVDKESINIEDSVETKIGGNEVSDLNFSIKGGAVVDLDSTGLDTSECSRNRNGEPCSSKKVIEKIAEVIKSTVTENTNIGKEEEKSELLPQTNSKEAKIIREAAKVLNCSSESCVLTSGVVKSAIGSDVVNKELAVNFKEQGPREGVAWLSNVNIDKTLQKWAVEFDDLYVFPFCMSDFYKTRSPLATINICDILEGKVSQKTALGSITRKCKRMCCVLNTDVSTGRGIHWVGIFVDCSSTPCSIEYWNSAGNPPFQNAIKWMEATRLALRECKKQVELYNVTSVAHQESDTECGVYTLFYIRKRLEGTPVQYFMDKRIPDSDMMEFRKYLFR